MTKDILFQNELNQLKGFGVELTDLESGEIVELVRAVDRFRNPYSGCNADAIGRPIKICEGKHLWKITIGASVWLDEYAKKWWYEDGSTKAYFWALVYALIHAREADAFKDLTDETAAHNAIMNECLRLPVSESELTEYVMQALEVRAPSKNKDADFLQTDWATIVARLEGQTGIESSKWCWDKSADYALRVHEELSRFARAAGGQKVGHLRDEQDKATKALFALRNKIIERVTKAKRAHQEVVNEQGN